MDLSFMLVIQEAEATVSLLTDLQRTDMYTLIGAGTTHLTAGLQSMFSSQVAAMASAEALVHSTATIKCYAI